ncbi:hypothetical protein BV25DRAFT_1910292 [Artomyces pyxidatus]|uniref:Uncharacterized protein n=1 Tax=Artomyces pyxidatus TaxID=48021 RepID=A0ACB8TJB9_9AGAM|nr:hypothetical protein BV25DRAFT_1910292 [Artomyces pyxidatus]
MRRSPSSTTRILTILSLLVLCTLSFTVVYGTSNIVDTPPAAAGIFHRRSTPALHRRAAHHLHRADDGGVPTPTSTSSVASSSAVHSTSATPVSSPAPKSSSSAAPVSSSVFSSAAPSSTSHSSSSAPTSHSTSSDTHSSSKTSTTQSSASSSATSSSLSSSSLRSSTISQSTPPATLTPTVPVAVYTPPSNSFLVTGTQSTITFSASGTGTASDSSKGFFANKAAVTGTFATVGILAGFLALAIVVFALRKRRHARDDDVFFEKYGDNNNGDNGEEHGHTAELGQGPLGASAEDLGAAPARHDAYPDRAIHHGFVPEPEVEQYAPPPRPMQTRALYTPSTYGIEYPPGTVFPGAQQQQEAPQQDAYNPFQHEGDAYAGYSEAQRTPSPRSTASNHPFADPANAMRAHAPPVQYRGYEPSLDSYYGGASAGPSAV